FGCMAISCSQQSGSSQSTRPSPSLSMQSPQISTGLADGSQPAIASWPQRPLWQLSVVQVLPSLQSDAVVHGWQPAIAACPHRPASQLSVVQALPSLQSDAVEQGWQPAIAACPHRPASQLA